MSATARDRLVVRLDEAHMEVVCASRRLIEGLSPALALFLLDALVRLAESYLAPEQREAA